ncbi:MAG: SHOCT domain-containing protein [Rhodothermales bacterium]
MMIFWSILLIVVLVMLLRLAPGLMPSTEEKETSLEKLQHQYASGKLTTEEYEERRRRLSR